MTFNIYNTLIIAGIIQGFIFTVAVLINKKQHARSTYLLVAIIFSYSLGDLQYVLPDIGAISLKKMHSFIYLPIVSLIPVLIYFYVVLFLYPLKKIEFFEKLLFIPFLIFLVLIIICRIGIILGYDNESFLIFFESVINLNDVLSIAFSIFLLFVSIQKVRLFEKQNKQIKISIIRTNLNWLKIILTIIFLLTLLWAYLTYRNNFILNKNSSFYSFWVGIAFIIYLLGYIGIYNFGIIQDRNNIRKHNSNKKKHSIYNQTNNEHIIAFENLLLNEKAFLDSQLSLESVAENLQLSASYLSRIIHSELKISFTDYLNSHRIEEAKTYLANPEFSNYTIISIGLEAGFNSKSTFFYIFKKATGKTPLAYQREMRTV